jgi:hypothetical protein
MVTVTVAPASRPDIVKEKKPCGNTNPVGLPDEGRDDSLTAVKLCIKPASELKIAVPVPVAVWTAAVAKLAVSVMGPFMATLDGLVGPEHESEPEPDQDEKV